MTKEQMIIAPSERKKKDVQSEKGLKPRTRRTEDVEKQLAGYDGSTLEKE